MKYFPFVLLPSDLDISTFFPNWTGTEALPVSFKILHDSSRSCPVFLSYQWDLQETVKGLKKRIEENGIQCWMDIGQMGGGDALFAKIDAGIRACKVSVRFGMALISPISDVKGFLFLNFWLVGIFMMFEWLTFLSYRLNMRFSLSW